MREIPKQLAFDLPLDPRYGREDFLVSPSNEQAYGLIEAWPDWPDTILLLRGPPGSGKSHLASIWATDAHAWTVRAGEVTGDTVATRYEDAQEVLDALAKVGIDYDDVIATLEKEGVEKFLDSFHQLLDDVKAKRDELAGAAR